MTEARESSIHEHCVVGSALQPAQLFIAPTAHGHTTRSTQRHNEEEGDRARSQLLLAALPSLRLIVTCTNAHRAAHAVVLATQLTNTLSFHLLDRSSPTRSHPHPSQQLQTGSCPTSHFSVKESIRSIESPSSNLVMAAAAAVPAMKLDVGKIAHSTKAKADAVDTNIAVSSSNNTNHESRTRDKRANEGTKATGSQSPC